MTVSAAHARSARAPRVVVAAFAGSRSGSAAIVPALHLLRKALPAAKRVLLWPTGVPMPAQLPALAHDCLHYPSPREIDCTDAPSTIAEVVAGLRAAAADTMIVFTEAGHAPSAPAYIAYLAGIENRIGMTGEFGGAVLSQPVAPPAAPMPDDERHLLVLNAADFTLPRGARLAPAPSQEPLQPRSR